MHRSTERQRKKKQLDLLKARDLTGKTRRKRQVQDISVLDLEGDWTVLAKSLWGCLLQLWQFKRSHQLLQLMVMKSPPVFLHWCWYWLFCPHLEQCWPHILIGIIREFIGGQTCFTLSSNVVIPISWFLFDLFLLNEGDRNWKDTCQHASFRLRHEEEVKEDKGRRRKRRGKKDGKMERSGFSDHTNYRNIQKSGSAKNISSLSTISFPCSLCPLRLDFSLCFFSPFYLMIPLGYSWWGTSCSMFSFSYRVLSLTTPRELFLWSI